MGYQPLNLFLLIAQIKNTSSAIATGVTYFVIHQPVEMSVSDI